MVLVSLACEAFIGLVFATHLAIVPLMFVLCHTDSFGFAGAKVRNYWQINEYPIGFIGKGLTAP